MKYGLLYYKNTDNIGDDIQTYAQLKFLPKIDYLIDREKLGMFIPEKKEMVSVIMNAWYLHNYISWPPSPYINPLMISMHFTCNDRLKGGSSYLNGKGLQYLNEHAPIGCRDYESVNRLKKLNVPCYLSGCLTLTLNKFDNIVKKDYICAVDVDDDIFNKINKNTNRKIYRISHDVNPNSYSKLNFDKRMNNVENLLKKYQRAHLIITSKLHVLLPALALGTPVILVHNDVYENDRFDTFLQYVKNFSKTEFLNLNIKKIIEEPDENKKEYLYLRENLEKECNLFIKKSKEFKLKNIPNISDYKKIVDYKEYYYNIYEECKKASLNNIMESNNYFLLLNNSREQLIKKENEIKIYINRINELETELNNKNNELSIFYNSKSFKIKKALKKILKTKKEK